MVSIDDSQPLVHAKEKHDLIERLKRQTGQLAAINIVVAAVSQSLDLDKTLQTALEAVLSVIPVEASGISLVDEAAEELVLRAQRGWNYDFVSNPMRIKLGDGMSGQVITTGEVMVTSGDVSHDPRLVVPDFAREQVRAMILAPMRARGKVVGVLSVMSHQPYQFEEEEVNMVRVIADQIGIALDNARLFEAVRAQQSRLEAVLQSTADAIIATDNVSNVNLVNQAAKRLFELDVAQVVGQPLRDAPLPPVVREKLRHAMAQDKGTPDTPQTFEVELENGIFVSGIVSRVYSVTQLTERYADGWVVVFQDITHIKQAERARLHFIQTAAHDLRNPLGVTLSALTMLNRNWKEKSERDHEIFNIALTGINRMQDLIDDLLNLEHIESGVDFRNEPINIPDLAERCAIDMYPVVQRREQTLQLAVDQALPPFYGDDRWLYRALINLISNAHKYTQQQSMIVIRAEKYDDSNLLLQVEDNGPGIPPDEMPHLFERFYRGRASEKKIPGTGLGLAMVKSVAEKHGGRVAVYSELEQGTVFRMIMPFQQAAPSEKE